MGLTYTRWEEKIINRKIKEFKGSRDTGIKIKRLKWERAGYFTREKGREMEQQNIEMYTIRENKKTVATEDKMER